jgi:hypothetical protein
MRDFNKDNPLWLDNKEDCDFYAVWIDTERGNIAGRVKGIVFRPNVPNDKMDAEDIVSMYVIYDSTSSGMNSRSIDL